MEKIAKLCKIRDIKIAQLERDNASVWHFKLYSILISIALVCLFYGFNYEDDFKSRIGTTLYDNWITANKSKEYLHGINYDFFKSQSDTNREKILALPEVTSALKNYKNTDRINQVYYDLIKSTYRLNVFYLEFTLNQITTMKAECGHVKAGLIDKQCNYGKGYIQSSVFSNQPALQSLYNDSLTIGALMDSALVRITQIRNTYSESIDLWLFYKDKLSGFSFVTIDQFRQLKNKDFEDWNEALRSINLDANSVGEKVLKTMENKNVLTLDNVIGYITDYLPNYAQNREKSKKTVSIFSIEIGIPIFEILLLSPFLIIISLILLAVLLRDRFNTLVDISGLDSEINNNEISYFTYGDAALATIQKNNKIDLTSFHTSYPYFWSDLFYIAVFILFEMFIFIKWFKLIYIDLHRDWGIWYPIGFTVLFTLLTFGSATAIAKLYKVKNFK